MLRVNAETVGEVCVLILKHYVLILKYYFKSNPQLPVPSPIPVIYYWLFQGSIYAVAPHRNMFLCPLLWVF